MKKSWSSCKAPLAYCFIMLLFFFPVVFLKNDVNPSDQIDEIVAVPAPVEVPDFANILDVQLKKQTFFNFVEHFVDQVNSEILQQREYVISIREKVLNNNRLTSNDIELLSALAEQYKLEDGDLTSIDHLDRLLGRVDKIPASLALAQAANESAWGTSRFARIGNNFFGQWCYTNGCGIVPTRRGEGASHEVRRFDSARESVRAYIHNLNTFPSYQTLRQIRQQLRQHNQPLNGVALADGLESYSARGHDYIDEMRIMIYSNNLLARDNPTL